MFHFTENNMPRPPNYIVKLRKWVRETNGDEGLKLSLLLTLQKYTQGKTKLEEVNKMVSAYSKSIVEVIDDVDELSDEMLDAYLSNGMDN